MTTDSPGPAAPASWPPPITGGPSRIVVGMDDDPVSLKALRFAAVEAAFRGGEVLAVHVWHYPYSWGITPVWPDDANPTAQITTQLQETISVALAERAQGGEPDVRITTAVVQGDAASMLTRAATGATLLVLGARHHNRILGSVSLACTSHPPCPVLIVPAEQ